MISMPREIMFRGYNGNNEGLTCSFCGQKFKINEKVIRTKTRYYHKRCFQKLLHWEKWEDEGI